MKAFNRDSNLGDEGFAVDAHITERIKSSSGYHIKYSFIDTGGIERKFERALSSKYDEMIKNNDYFLITYLPSDPTIHILGEKPATGLSNLTYGFLGAALLLCGWGMWGIGSSMLQLARIHRLFNNGKVGMATVGDWVSSPRTAGMEKDQMTFHFVAADGRWYEGRSRSFNHRFQSKWPKGSHVKVVYDSVRPLHCEPDVFNLIVD